jgi:transposase
MTLATILAQAPASPEQAENEALLSILAEFDSDPADARKIDYLKNRYAGFRRKEAATLVGVSIITVNKWIKLDTRVARYDALVSTGKRREFRKDVLQEEWFRNFYLVLRRDEYILKKVHGLLEESYLEVTASGKQTRKVGSPAMRKEDWDYFAQMRKMYTPDAWASIEKVLAGSQGQLNIAEFIINIARNQQVVTGQNGHDAA